MPEIKVVKKKKQYQVVNEDMDFLKWLNDNMPIQLGNMVIYNGLQAKIINITSRPELDGMLYISKDINDIDCDMVYHKSISDKPVYFIDFIAYIRGKTWKQGYNIAKKELEKQQPKEAAVKDTIEATGIVTSQIDLIANSRGKAEKCLKNIRSILEAEKIVVRRNELTKGFEFIGIDYDLSCPEATYTTIGEICLLNYGLRISNDDLYKYLTVIAIKNTYNPIVDYLNDCKLTHPPVNDNECELVKLLDTITWDTDNENHIKYYNAILIKWLCNAYRMADNTLDKGYVCDIVPVFKGGQGIGKTQWIKRLAPKQFIKDGFILDTKDKDNKLLVSQYWIVELAELGGTFDKSDQNSLKAYISQSYDDIRPPYERQNLKYPRRTVFFATINDEEYLTDDTGNRRFITLPVLKLDYKHDIDMAKVWHEISDLVENGVIPTYLTADEIKMNDKLNNEFRKKTKHELLLDDLFDWDSTEKGAAKIVDIANFIKLRTGQAIPATAIRQVLKLHNCKQDRIRINGIQGRYWIIPFTKDLTTPF